MARSSTVVMYPLGWYVIGRGLLYLALLWSPAMLAQWVASLAPSGLQSAAQFVAGVVLMPALYWGLYEMLRRAGARSQSFIYLLVLMFALFATLQLHQAISVGGWNHWLTGLMMIPYALGFAWIAYRGSRRNQAEAEAAYHAGQEEQIHIQTQAILRAKAIRDAASSGD